MKDKVCSGDGIRFAVQYVRRCLRHVPEEWQRLRGGAVVSPRFRRRLRWLVLVMISRRREVDFPALGRLSVNGIRLWGLCFFMALWVLVRVS